jgi:uncharacterized protein
MTLVAFGAAIPFFVLLVVLIRWRMRRCDCGGQRVDVAESELVTLLNERQRKEYELGSVRFTALRCPACSSVRLRRYPVGSIYSPCQSCDTWAVMTVRTPIVSTQQFEVRRTCAACGAGSTTIETAPVYSPSNDFGGFSSGGSLGGGDFGGGSSGGGDFGGGSSGGGGAGSSF